MGNKILRGERKLTLDHVRKLAVEFHLQPGYFFG
jgi:antitoxin component HigA of HigAB toxin-antitoxin module